MLEKTTWRLYSLKWRKAPRCRHRAGGAARAIQVLGNKAAHALAQVNVNTL